MTPEESAFTLIAEVFADDLAWAISPLARYSIVATRHRLPVPQGLLRSKISHREIVNCTHPRY